MVSPTVAVSSPLPADDTRADGARVLAASYVLLVSGPGFVAAAIGAPALLTAFYDLVATPGTVTVMDAAARLGAALFGALTFGWGVTLHALGRGARIPRAVLQGVIAWFVVDSAASVLLGYAWNTVSNAGFLLVIAALLRSRRRGPR
jgi:hypothetical protein